MEKATDLQIWLDGVLEKMGMPLAQAQEIDKWILFAGIIILALVINLFLRMVVLRVVGKIVRKTKAKWTTCSSTTM
jgi:miniconductance mechanosensitive channel